MNLSTRAKWLTGIAAAIAGYVVLGPKDPESAEPARAATAAHAAHAGSSTAPAPGVPLARSLLALAQRVAGEGAAGALFATRSWAPPPPPPAPPVVNTAPAAPPKPVAPPLPFTYIGSYAPDGVAPVFFLTQGDRVYDVHVGDTVNDTYHVDAFANGQLIFTYKPLNEQQQLITGGKP